MLGALGAHGREGPDELHGEVVGDGVEETRVIDRDRPQALPAHLDNRDHVTAEPYGHGDEAREGREEARANAEDLVGVLVHDLADGELALAQGVAVGGDNPQTDGARLARGQRLEGAPVSHELGHLGAGERVAQAAEVEAVGLGEVDHRAVGVHGLGDLLEDASEEGAHVTRVERVEDDFQGAREPLVGAGEVGHGTRPLVLGDIDDLEGICDEKVRLAGRVHAVAADAQGHGGAVCARAGDDAGLAVDGEGKLVRGEVRLGVVALRGREEAAHVRSQDVGAVAEHAPGDVVGDEDATRPVKGDDRLARELQQHGQGAREAPLADSLDVSPAQRLRSHASPKVRRNSTAPRAPRSRVRSRSA